MSEGEEPSANKISRFIPDTDLQGSPAVRDVSTDEETSGRNSPLSAYSDSESSFDFDGENVNNLSIQEEIKHTIKDKYHDQYKEISEWLGEFPSDEEMKLSVIKDNKTGWSRKSGKTVYLWIPP